MAPLPQRRGAPRLSLVAVVFLVLHIVTAVVDPFTHLGIVAATVPFGYNALQRGALDMPVRDAQCGFKAVRASVARALLPSIEDQRWFFDSELLARAHHAGFRVAELPVRWVEDRDSRVRVVRTAIADLRGVRRLRRCGLHRPRPGRQPAGAVS